MNERRNVLSGSECWQLSPWPPGLASDSSAWLWGLRLLPLAYNFCLHSGECLIEHPEKTSVPASWFLLCSFCTLCSFLPPWPFFLPASTFNAHIRCHSPCPVPCGNSCDSTICLLRCLSNHLPVSSLTQGTVVFIFTYPEFEHRSSWVLRKCWLERMLDIEGGWSLGRSVLLPVLWAAVILRPQDMAAEASAAFWLWC